MVDDPLQEIRRPLGATTTTRLLGKSVPAAHAVGWVCNSLPVHPTAPGWSMAFARKQTRLPGAEGCGEAARWLRSYPR
jgi:hypothetical protein